MVFTSVMKPLHTKRGVCILEAKIIDPEFGERFAFKQTDGTIVKRSNKELRLTITHCPYCGTHLKFLFLIIMIIENRLFFLHQILFA